MLGDLAYQVEKAVGKYILNDTRSHIKSTFRAIQTSRPAFAKVMQILPASDISFLTLSIEKIKNWRLKVAHPGISGEKREILTPELLQKAAERHNLLDETKLEFYIVFGRRYQYMANSMMSELGFDKMRIW